MVGVRVSLVSLSLCAFSWALESPPLPNLNRRSMVVGMGLMMDRQAAVAKCTDIESCREEGDRRAEEADRKAGPTVKLSGGVMYRELEAGTGPKLSMGDGADIRFQVLQSANGYFMYGVPNREPGSKDLGETYRVTLGQRDIPEGVELAMVGASKGTRRRVQLPRSMGFETSEWRPQPTGYAGQQRIKRFQNILYGTSNQPGYDAQILFEFEVAKVRPASK